MNAIRATFQIVTPMFLGGAVETTPELRPPSIKGALRFWWRAMCWGRCLAEAGGTEKEGLRLLHSREGRIFGAAASENEGGQSLFRLRAVLESPRPASYPERPRTGQAYLLGRGLLKGVHYLRRALPAGQRLATTLRFRRGTSPQEQLEVEQALFLWGLLGGLGSRARKGYGSVALETIEGAHSAVPRDLGEFKKTLRNLVDPLSEHHPPLTAFSAKTRIDCSLQGPDPMMLLENVGIEMKMYRSWGRKGLVDGIPEDREFGRTRTAEKNFADDHRVALHAAEGGIPSDLPRRIVFGLPHSYYFSSVKSTVFYEVEGQASGQNLRRASPLLIHIHRFPDGSSCAIQALLPGLFLPRGLQVAVKSKGPRCTHRKDFHPVWPVIYDYLDRFDKREPVLA